MFNFSHIADQTLRVLPITMQNMAVTLVCMAVISVLFMPQPVCTLWIILSLLSIDIGYKLLTFIIVFLLCTTGS